MLDNIYVHRLNRVIEVLEKVKAEHLLLDMNNWLKHSSCGTSCCAIGWACFEPDLQEQGLVLFYGDKLLSFIPTSPPYNEYNFYPAFIKDNELHQLREFFGISDDQFHYMFMSKNGDNPDTVIARIKEVIANETKENENAGC